MEKDTKCMRNGKTKTGGNKFLAALLICALMLAGCSAERDDYDDLETDGGRPDEVHGLGEADSNLKEQESSGTGGDERDSVEGGSSFGDDLDANSEEGRGDEDGVAWRLRIVDGAETGALVLAGEGAGEVYTVSLADDMRVSLDGQRADRSVLEDGMMVELVFDGSVMETFPGQLGQIYEVCAYSRGTKQNPGGTYYDLCGLYLQVLEDLWNVDSGLNSDIELISLDLSQEPGGLTEGEKQAVAWVFGSRHGVTPLTLSYEQLAEEGYLAEAARGENAVVYQWENGVLFSITAAERKEGEDGELFSLPVLRFDAEKWRSPRGAYFFMDCSALWPEMGTWEEYDIGGEAIS